MSLFGSLNKRENFTCQYLDAGTSNQNSRNPKLTLIIDLRRPNNTGWQMRWHYCPQLTCDGVAYTEISLRVSQKGRPNPREWFRSAEKRMLAERQRHDSIVALISLKMASHVAACPLRVASLVNQAVLYETVGPTLQAKRRWLLPPQEVFWREKVL